MSIHRPIMLSSAPAIASAGALITVRRWRSAGLASVIGSLAIVVLFGDTSLRLLDIWLTSPTYNHGLLIPAVSAWLISERQRELSEIPPEPAFLGLLALCLAAGVWLAGHLGGIKVVEQVALVAMIQAYVLAIAGVRATWAMAFPLAYLYFAVPVGDGLVPHLQQVTAYMAVGLLRAAGIPVFADGVFLSTPSGNFLVAEACAGLRFLIASLALGVLLAHLLCHSWWRRAAILVLSAAVPVAANGVRAFGIIALAYATDNEVAVGFDHLIYGWIFFSLVTLLLIAAGFMLRDHTPPRRGHVPPFLGAANGAFARRLRFNAAAGLALAAAATGYGGYALRAEAAKAAPTDVALPAVAEPWRPVAAPDGAWRPRFAAPDQVLQQSFARDGARVDVHLAYYRHERPGAEAVTGGHAYEGEGWKIGNSGGITAIIDGTPRGVTYLQVDGKGTRMLVWRWYWVGGDVAGGVAVGKLKRLMGRLAGEAPGAAAIALAIEYRDSPQAAAEQLQDFLNGLGPLKVALGGRP
jgi:exosortase A